MEETLSTDQDEFWETQSVFVLGDPDKVAAGLKTVPTLRVQPLSEAIGQEQSECYLVYQLAQLSNQSLLDLIVKLTRYESVLVRKVVCIEADRAVSPYVLHLLAELRVDYVAKGPQALLNLWEFLKAAHDEAIQVGALAGYKRAIHQAHLAQDPAALSELVRRVERLGGERGDKTFLVVQGYLWAGLATLAEHALKRQLACDPQALWAVSLLASLYIQKNKIPWAVELLERLGNFHRLNFERFLLLGNLYQRAGMFQEALIAHDIGCKITESRDPRFKEAMVKSYLALGRWEPAFAMMKGLAFSWAGVTFLFEQSLAAMGRRDYPHQVQLLEALLPALASKPLEQAKVRYNLAIGYLAQTQLGKAQDVLEACPPQRGDIEPALARLRQLLLQWRRLEQSGQAVSAEQRGQTLKSFKPLVF